MADQDQTHPPHSSSQSSDPPPQEPVVSPTVTEAQDPPTQLPPLDSATPSQTQMDEPEPTPPPPEETHEEPDPQPELPEVIVKEEPSPAAAAAAEKEPESREKLKEFLADGTSTAPESLVSFKEESNKIADLSDSERNALTELKGLIQGENPKEEVSIWGVPLFADDRTDVILLKFLRAREFKVKDSLAMFNNTVRWRKEFGIEELLDEDLGDDLDKVVFMHGADREGHPVCYNVFGEFQNTALYRKTFSDEEKRARFLRSRVQLLEKSIRKLDFSPGGVSTIVQVNDLKNSPWLAKKDLRIATRQAVQLLQDNYPEFVAKQVFVNVPWWYAAFFTMISPFMTQRTKSKFVFVGPAKTPDTLFKFIAPEQVPVQYGGMSVDFCDCNPDFTVSDPVTVMSVKPGTKQIVEIIIYETCVIVWELRVVGWEVSYGAEFVPNADGAYTIIINKPRKMSPRDEPVVRGSYKVEELGKILLTVDNPTSKTKKLLYRFNVKPLS